MQGAKDGMRMNEVKRAGHKVKMNRDIPISAIKSRWKIESASRVKGVGLCRNWILCLVFFW